MTEELKMDAIEVTLRDSMKSIDDWEALWPRVGDIIMAPYKKFTWVDRMLWRLFRYELKRKTETRKYVVTETVTSDDHQPS